MTFVQKKLNQEYLPSVAHRQSGDMSEVTLELKKVPGGYWATPVNAPNTSTSVSPSDVMNAMMGSLFQSNKNEVNDSYTPETFQKMTNDELTQSYFQILSQNPNIDFSKTTEEINDWLDDVLFDSGSLGDSTISLGSESAPMSINLANYYTYLNSLGVDVDLDAFLENLNNVYETRNLDGTSRYQYAVSDADRERFKNMGASPLAADIMSSSQQQADKMSGSGYCARGVRLAFERLGIYGVGAASAYQMGHKLAKDKRFVEVLYTERKPGDVLIFGKTSSREHGHAEILQENGMATSDTQGREKNPETYGGQVRVFRYQQA